MTDLARDADDVIAPRRSFVPSEREVDEGLAEYTFEPLPPPAPEPPFNLGAKVRELREQLNPRSIVSGHPTLPLVLLSLDRLFTHWDDTAFGVLLPEIRDEFGFSLDFLLVLGSTIGIVTLALGPVMGYLADRISRVRMLAVGNVTQNAASVVQGFVGSPTQLGLCKLGGGVGGAISTPTALPLLADWYPANTRARLVAFVSMCGGLGLVVAPQVAGGMGSLVGWRLTLVILGGFSTVISFAFFLLKEPIRGRLDRKAMGVDDDVANREQKPVSWGEGWRAAGRVRTLRRLWYATPFLVTGTAIQTTLMSVYWADEFGLGPTLRGTLLSGMAVVGLLALPFAGPVADRLLARDPGRVFTLVGGISLVGTGSLIVLGFSPFLWLSILAVVPVAVLGALVLPATLTLISLVMPARLRAFGMATQTPWQLMGQAMIFGLVKLFEFTSVREALFILVPINLIAAILYGTGGGGVESDIRAARAASMADEEARRARESGANKMLICRDVDVTYGGTQVLFNVDFDVEEGELVALLGTNGAGKSTLLRAIAGIQEASNGAIFLDGEDITHRPPHQNAEGGIVFMPGGRAIFPTLTVEENLRSAAWMYRRDEEHVKRRTEEVLDFFPILRERLKQQAGTMSGGEQQMLALGQAFLMKPRLLMIDELSLGLSPAIVEQLLDIVGKINEQGTTVILVEQSVNVALTIARRAVFMEKGEIRFDGPTRELLGRGDLLRSVFLGAASGGGGAFIASGTGLKRAGGTPVEQVLAASDVHLSYGGHKVLDGAHIDVTGGEVVGIIGPNGAGKTTLFDVISGYTQPEHAEIVIAGVDAAGLGPDARARLGLRRSFQNARLFPALTVEENIAVALEQRLSSRSAVAAAAWLPVVRKSERRVRRRVSYLVDLLNLEAYAHKFVSELSTGSRRMVDMACVMASEPRVLMLDEPSSGLAQSEVEVLGPVVRRLAKETGCGVLVIEHDMPLITALSDRLVVMELGTVLLEGKPDEVVTDPRVVSAYLGASKAAIGRSGAAFVAALASAGLEPEAGE